MITKEEIPEYFLKITSIMPRPESFSDLENISIIYGMVISNLMVSFSLATNTDTPYLLAASGIDALCEDAKALCSKSISAFQDQFPDGI